MALSNDLISQFAKLTNTNKKEDTGAEVKGTFVTIGGIEYVRLDGSEILTPVSTAVEAVADERVVVLIKDHMAEVIKNITSPAARNKSVSDIKDEVDEFGNTIQQMDNTIIQQGNSIIQMDNAINQANNTINQHNNLINQQGDTIVSLNNTIVQQGNQISSINNTVVEQGNNIISINNTVNQQGDNINSMNNVISQQGNTITQQGNTISQQGNQINQFGDIIESQNNTILQLGNNVTSMGNQVVEIDNTVKSYDNRILMAENNINVQGSEILILNSGFQIVDGVLTGLSGMVVDSLKTNHLNAVYAEIDFANIEIAAVEKLFTESGIIKDLIIKEGHVTGELVGVTIKGDLIEGNTIKADKLVVLGEDGLYYKLNVNAEKVETEQTEENSLNGSIITAKSITASKVTVTDLVAFGATIAGFTINDYSIHSETKGSIDSPAKGLYFDKDGQFYLGDSQNHVRYYKIPNPDDPENEDYQLDIKSSRIFFGTSGQNLNDVIGNINELNTSHGEAITQLSMEQGNISMSVSNVTNDLKNNYLPKGETNQLVQTAVEGLVNTFSKVGGNNLFQNSSLFFGEENAYDYWQGNVKQVSIDVAVTGKGFGLQTGILKQNVVGFGAGDLSLRFKFKKTGVGIGSQLQFKINETIFDIVETEGVIEYSFLNTSGSTMFEIITNQSNQYVIYDLMLNYGKDIFLPYQQAMNELKSSTIQISENIKAESNTSNTITTLGADGLRGYNKSTGTIVFKQTDDGLYSAMIRADEAEISDLMIKKVGNQVWITGK